jgi:hypothetical protein
MGFPCIIIRSVTPVVQKNGSDKECSSGPHEFTCKPARYVNDILRKQSTREQSSGSQDAYRDVEVIEPSEDSEDEEENPDADKEDSGDRSRARRPKSIKIRIDNHMTFYLGQDTEHIQVEGHLFVHVDEQGNPTGPIEDNERVYVDPRFAPGSAREYFICRHKRLSKKSKSQVDTSTSS